MVDDEREYEPDEYDPEADLPDPEEELAPSIDIPEAPEPMPESEAPDEIFRIFWWVVIVVNVGILALSLGAMIWFFEGMATWGFRLVAVGVIALGYAYLRYRIFMRDTDVWDEEAAEGDAAVAADGDLADGGVADADATGPVDTEAADESD